MARPGRVSRPLHGCILAALMVAALCLSPEAAGAPPASGGAEARCEEEELIKTCMNTKGKDNRLCYYLGATEDAATKILTEVSRPMSVHIPVAKICEKLKKGDSQICELKYERQLDLTSVDLSKMRAAELKKILDSWGEVCRACAEKREFVDLIKELAPKHTAPPAKADL